MLTIQLSNVSSLHSYNTNTEAEHNLFHPPTLHPSTAQIIAGHSLSTECWGDVIIVRLYNLQSINPSAYQCSTPFTNPLYPPLISPSFIPKVASDSPDSLYSCCAVLCSPFALNRLSLPRDTSTQSSRRRRS